MGTPGALTESQPATKLAGTTSEHNMNTEHRQMPDVTAPNMIAAVQAVQAMAARRGLEIKGEVGEIAVPHFPSEAQMQKRRKQMHRALSRPTMKSANAFLAWAAGGARVVYSAREEAIRARKREYDAAVAVARAARGAYLFEKGDFYGGRVRVEEHVDEKTKVRTVVYVSKVTDRPSE